MSDNKLKIRINIQQTKGPGETEETETAKHSPPDLDAHAILEKPPFDWRKITVVLLLFTAILGTIGYFLWHQNNDQINVVVEHPEAPDNDAAKTEHDPPRGSDASSTKSTQDYVSVDPFTPPDKPTTEHDNEIADTNQLIAPDSKPIAIPEIYIPKPDLKPESKTTTQENESQQNHDGKVPPQAAPETDDHEQVIRAQLTHAIQQREPVDKIDQIQLKNDTSQSIYFFVELRNFAGQAVTVNWYYKEKPVAKTTLQINGNNWRTYANKLLNTKSTGSWRVILTDDAGNQLAERFFTVSNNL